MTRIIAVASQKGGVGKTSLVQNVGAELIQRGRSVLLVDFDPQSNLTEGCGLDPAVERATVYTAMLDPVQTEACIVQLPNGVHLLPADLDLSGAELQFAGAVDRNIKLAEALEPVSSQYDYILIDGPPSLGFFTINALAAADEVIVPLQCQVYAFKAITRLLEIVQQVRKMHPPLTLTGVVLTMYDARNNLTFSVEDAARDIFKDLVFQTPIPVNVRIAEAPLEGKAVRDYDSASTGASAYAALVKEIDERGKAE